MNGHGGRIVIHEDFDELPPDFSQEFGIARD
jgi:hypothetical protein